MWPSSFYGDLIMERLDKLGSSIDRKHLKYPDAGHAISFPYEPTFEKPFYHPVPKKWFILGGSKKGNAYADKNSWKQALNYLDRLEKVYFDEKKWKIGGKIHFEEKSASDYLGTIAINMLTREALSECFNFKIDYCAHNAKALIKKENNDYILTHYEEKNSPGIGEEMHATLLYTSKRVANGHETLKDIYKNLMCIDDNLSSDNAPTVKEVAQAYHKIINPDWEFEISDIIFIKGKTGSCIIAKLLHEGRDEIINKQGKPISGNFLHMSLVNVDPSIDFEDKKIDLVVNKLKEKLLNKKIKIANINGLADLEFGITGSKTKDRIRPKTLKVYLEWKKSNSKVSTMK